MNGFITMIVCASEPYTKSVEAGKSFITYWFYKVSGIKAEGESTNDRKFFQFLGNLPVSLRAFNFNAKLVQINTC